jgi:uncharacterized membrane protein
MKPAKFLGHHVHPMLIVFPLGLLAASVAFDTAYLASDNPVFAQTAYWNILAGCIGGLAAAVFGFWDWLAIAPRTRAKRVGAVHGTLNVIVVALFAVSWWIRRGDALHVPTTAALVLSFAAVSMALVGAWLGGELVERLGIAVAPDADPNAQSSLSS